MSNLRSVVLVSGPYDLVALMPHLDARGLHPPLLEAIMGGRDVLPTVSPTLLAQCKEYQVRRHSGRRGRWHAPAGTPPARADLYRRVASASRAPLVTLR